MRSMLPFVAGGAVAVFVLELSRWRPAAEAEPEPFDANELAATDDAVARLWPTEPTFDWGPDDENCLRDTLARWRALAARARRPAVRPELAGLRSPRLAS